MRLGNEHLLVWLFALIPLSGLIVFFIVRRIKLLKKIGDRKVSSFLTDSFSKRKAVTKTILLFLAFVLLGVSIINPQIGTRLKDIKRKGIELVIAIDVSNSMLASDVSPSRLQRAKYAISDMIDELGGDRAGLIVFAGTAFQQCPMTLDHSALKTFIDIISPSLIQAQGTNFAAAIEESIKTLSHGSLQGKSNEKPSQVVIIVSDGENNEEGYADAIKEANEKNIKIFTAGIGSEKGTPIPILDRNGNVKDYKRDKNGAIITTMFNQNTLMEISQKTDGKFYRISENASNFDKITDALKALDQKEIETKQLVDYDDKYQVFLVMALALLFIESIIGDKKRKKNV